jgi:hypothetical protein
MTDRLPGFPLLYRTGLWGALWPHSALSEQLLLCQYPGVGLRLHVAAPPSRPSAGDRERVVRRLRDACEDEKLSFDTFTTRLDRAYAVRTQSELAEITRDIREPSVARRLLLATVTWISGWLDDISAAWSAPRRPRLVLPVRSEILIGRVHSCDLVISDPTVSTRHAFLGHVDGRWFLRDLGTTNGTFVNGARVIDEIEVAPGDELALGASSFVLLAP